MTLRFRWTALPLFAATLWSGAVCARYEPEVWLQEFATLRADMAAHYANLDWMVAYRKIDLPALTRETQAALRAATTDGQARKALARFVESFDDPHLRLVPSAPSSRASGRARTESGCTELGFEVRNRSFRFPFEKAAGWKRAGGSWFPAGSFGEVGVIRIAHFGEDGYLEACREVGPGGVRMRLQGELRKTIATLRERGVRVLVVDISGNGGGTEWVEQVTRLLTSKHLHRPGARKSEPTCDRTGIWDGRDVCPVLGESTESTMNGDGAWDGPLALLVDGETASASEDMVVWLRESGAATIIGERTYGAGCGYVGGGAPSRLSRIGLTVLMPNCARFTSDGVNEIEGVPPDVLLPLRKPRAKEQLRRLVAALPSGAPAARP